MRLANHVDYGLWLSDVKKPLVISADRVRNMSVARFSAKFRALSMGSAESNDWKILRKLEFRQKFTMEGQLQVPMRSGFLPLRCCDFASTLLPSTDSNSKFFESIHQISSGTIDNARQACLPGPHDILL